CETARQTYLSSFEVAAQNSPVDMGEVMKILADILPDDVIITHGAGNFALWPNRFMKFGSKARLLGPQSGAMGAGVPAAIAAKARHPDRTVLCFAGDGDFQMNGNELGTAMQENIQPIILILNNGTYGTIRMHQERTYPNRVSGTDLVNPDFVALASAYGFYGERVSNTDEFRAAFDRALASPTGAIL
ncbi:MAG: thiamine pyrophosphate-dependent enzyme, partial [Candidatus Puniceispirillaceae bacterium]